MTLSFSFDIYPLIPRTPCLRKWDIVDAPIWNFNKIEMPNELNDEFHYRHLDALYCYKRLLFEGKKTKFFGLHRSDGWPAYITRTQIHWFEALPDKKKSTVSECHRIGGPASLILLNGVVKQEYCQNGKFHREDGPAIIAPSYVAWYENHKFIKKESLKNV